MKTAKLLVSGLALLAAFASVARADLVPPDVTECQSATAGASCRGGAGTCVMDTCSRLDYANWNRDASPSPPSVQYACLRCVSGDGGLGGAGGTGGQSAIGGTTARGGTGGQSAIGGTTVASGTGGQSAIGGTTAVVGTGGQNAVTTASVVSNTGGQGGGLVAGDSGTVGTGGAGGTSGSDRGKPDDSSGCAVGGGWLSAKALGPWLLAGLFGAIVMLARRRRR